MNTDDLYPDNPDDQYNAGLITETERDVANALDAGSERGDEDQ